MEIIIVFYLIGNPLLMKLNPVSKVEARYSTHSVKVTWKKHKKAKFYRVYYYKENGDVHLAGITKGTVHSP